MLFLIPIWRRLHSHIRHSGIETNETWHSGDWGVFEEDKDGRLGINATANLTDF